MKPATIILAGCAAAFVAWAIGVHVGARVAGAACGRAQPGAAAPAIGAVVAGAAAPVAPVAGRRLSTLAPVVGHPLCATEFFQKRLGQMSLTKGEPRRAHGKILAGSC